MPAAEIGNDIAVEWGAKRPGALVAALPPFGLGGYLTVSDTGSVVVQVLLIAIAGILAMRGFGLRRAGIESSPEDGTLRIDTEFEGPEEGMDG